MLAVKVLDSSEIVIVKNIVRVHTVELVDLNHK